jgi:tetratricopeptide (TPR) repeat protein
MTHEKEKYGALLDELVQKHPKHPFVLLYAAFHHYGEKDFDKAETLLARQVKEAKDPAAGWYYRGQIAEEQRRSDDALEAYAKALEAAPHYEAASAAYANVLLGGKSLRAIIMSATRPDIERLVKEHEKLFKLAPKDPWVRNNLGFILRDVYVAKNQTKEWEPVLRDSVRFYQDATDIIGEWNENKRQATPFWKRYQYAGVISDTALMYQFYEPTKDYDRAIKLYERALEYSDYAYLDSWNNLRKLYEELERWDDLYDLAEMCADGIADEAGKPDEARRAQARTVMKQLLESGKVKDQ